MAKVQSHRLARAPARAPAGLPHALPGGLIYVSDALLPGITRRGNPGSFSYLRSDGRPLDAADLERIRGLAIPPAYREVWICPWPSGHLQATARDARGRKQYRYHASWSALRNADKFDRIEAFGRALPAIRRRVVADLALDDGKSVSHRLVLATLVRLLDTTFARVGNEAYVRQNGSYGLTTLRNRHAEITTRGRVRLSFRGKSGVRQELSLDDPRIARVVRRCKHLPGQELFQFQESGSVRGIGSGDVNDYLFEAAGERFTAKDFRTWHGTVEALELTRRAYFAKNESTPGATPQQILMAVARRLGNTVAVSRKSYVHPQVLALAQSLADDGTSPATLWESLQDAGAAIGGLHSAERRLLDFLAQSHAELNPPAQTRNKVAA